MTVSDSGLGAALDALRRGEVVVYPTETLYGLGADALDEAAVSRVAALKGRDAGKPMLVLVASTKMLESLASEVPDIARRLIDAFWPGPLTIVLPARAALPRGLTAGRETVGARHSAHPIAQALAEQLGRPITSTSANPGGEVPAASVEAAERYFGDRVAAFVDGGPATGRLGSTVVDVSGRKAVLVREGVVPAAAIERAGIVLIRAGA